MQQALPGAGDPGPAREHEQRERVGGRQGRGRGLPAAARADAAWHGLHRRRDLLQL